MEFPLYQFKALSASDQGTILFTEGVHLGGRLDEQIIIVLYQLFSFHVEAYYCPKTNEILRLRSFSTIDQLAPYLNKMDISHLLI